MLYFKKVYIPREEKVAVEAALRHFSLRRTMALDFGSSVSDIGQDKFFYGHIGKEDLKFTRIRTTFERYLPKIIFSLSNAVENSDYRFRLSLFSTVVFCIPCFGILLSILSMFIGNTAIQGLLFLSFILIFFISLILLELSITQARIKKAISKYGLIRKEG